MSSTDDESEALDIFTEPNDFYAPDKPATSSLYTTKQGTEIPLRLVGHNPLWGHLLWNAGRIIARYIEDNAAEVVTHKNVLELGAGAGLPSLICALHGAKKVVVTDYPDADLIENLRYNICHSIDHQYQHAIVAKGYLWGNDVQPLKAELTDPDTGFDVLILADILFNHSEHEKLILTMNQTLGGGIAARALVFFTPYRPWLLEKDLRFFELAKQAGFAVNKLFEHVMDKVMFPEDPGDETLRRTVFAYEVKWPT
ncbi:Protein N-terminal and lysine N-methyltransferase efm7 [Knufia obscura]|uniref:Protein N-terminal and lysine N-methyltransferase EFM7 n=2 Tax=Knufia TaxID=430999 RepID=A0AAN8ELH3_9EURO|nr:Protein N-terminal and lysine N-methyltransferase efm7 [Knufia obscura]KAK5958529.1 Protein N-terminal and lysine N-methyltransferase efm7 [Knufia fluminis]